MEIKRLYEEMQKMRLLLEAGQRRLLEMMVAQDSGVDLKMEDWSYVGDAIEHVGEGVAHLGKVFGPSSKSKRRITSSSQMLKDLAKPATVFALDADPDNANWLRRKR